MATRDAADVRLDKWLWAARFFKTRSLAVEAIGRGRVEVNGQVAKASRSVRVGDRLRLRTAGGEQVLEVRALSSVRGPAAVAQTLYAETAESLAAREARERAARRAPEPAVGREHGRPSKRDRRQWADWQRWSAALPPPGRSKPED